MWKGGAGQTSPRRRRKPVNTAGYVAGSPKGGARGSVHATDRPVRVSPPYAPTPTGKAAERKAQADAARTRASAALGILRGAHVPPDPQSALQQAIYSGVSPSPEFRKLYGNDIADKIDQERIRHYVAPREGVHADPLAELAIDTVATAGLGGAAGLLSKGAKVALTGTKAARAIKASEEIAAESGAARAARVAQGGIVRKGVANAARKLEPDAIRAARAKTAARAAKVAERTPKPVRVGAKVGARVAAHPFKHPFTAPFTAQAPFAAIHGDPGEFVKAAEGHGVLADVAGVAGGAAGALPVAGQVAREAVNLPAVIVPSLYLTSKAGVEAAGGERRNSTRCGTTT